MPRILGLFEDKFPAKQSAMALHMKYARESRFMLLGGTLWMSRAKPKHRPAESH